jgi:aminopeptidase N
MLSLELRWAMLVRLAVLGALQAEEIDAECAMDLTTAGVEAGAAARASLPSAEAKAAAWAALMADDDTAMGERRSIARGFWRLEHVELTRPYLDRYLAEMPPLFAGSSPTRALSIANRAFPITHVEPRTFAAVDALLNGDALDPSFRRVLLERRHDLERAQRARELDAQA